MSVQLFFTQYINPKRSFIPVYHINNMIKYDITCGITTISVYYFGVDNDGIYHFCSSENWKEGSFFTVSLKNKEMYLNNDTNNLYDTAKFSINSAYAKMDVLHADWWVK
jgi:hypothetical protein